MIVIVKYLANIHSIEIEPNATVADLALQLQSLLSIQTTPLSLFCNNQILARDRKISTLDQSKQLLAISSTMNVSPVSQTTSDTISQSSASNIPPQIPPTTSTPNLIDQFLPSLIQSHPGISSLIEQHPELRSMLNDPNFIRQQMVTMSNPALRQEMERQQDLQLAQIESHPGGMGHLENVYRTLNSDESDRSSIQLAFCFNYDIMIDVRVKKQTGPSIPNQVLNITPLPNPWDTTSSPSTPITNTNTVSRSPLNTSNNLVESLLSQSNTSARQTSNSNSNSSQRQPDLNQMMNQVNQMFPGASSGTNQAFNQLASQAMGGQVNLQGLGGLANVGLQSGTGRQQPADLSQMMSQMESMFPGALSSTNAQMNQMMAGMGMAHTGVSSNGVTGRPVNGRTDQRLPTADLSQMMSQMESMFPGASNGTNAQRNQMMAGMGQPTMSNLFGRMREAPIVEGGLNIQELQPEIRFAEQLLQLRDMGFIDNAANLRALTRSGGDLELAIAHILEL